MRAVGFQKNMRLISVLIVIDQLNQIIKKYTQNKKKEQRYMFRLIFGYIKNLLRQKN